MNAQEQNNIYERLLEIKVDIDVDLDQIPKPQYINMKIGQCHTFIEEVEKYSIRVNREMSVLQRVLNDTEAEYEAKLDSLISDDEDIQSLPSIKDREAKAKGMLRDDLSKIKEYKNNLSDINNLSKAINLKLKNLNRANTDIKIQMRLMESQLKIGPMDETAAKSLMEEMKKGIYGKDSFEDAEVESEEINIADPSEELDIENVLGKEYTEPDISMEDSENIISPEEYEKESKVVDLDKVLDTNIKTLKTGGDNQKEPEKERVISETKPESEPQPKTQSQNQKSDEINIDSLLEQWQ